ncbi:SGF29 tudor-like domain [Striga hermonthica]|uniref:SGF29 tudor-like domain n=1 Tax=Striga hermonthica TaxID=68872 RepID=A0A9N7N8S5_STRHE|nr:SGF29 tudor-like domain [Striga hermonthica]
MSSSADIVAGILENSKEVDRLRKELDEVLLEINKLHNKLLSTPEVVEKPGDNSLSRLKMLYTRAKELSETEASVATQLLGQLDALLPTGTPGQHRKKIEGGEQKKKRIKGDTDVPRLSPSTRSHLESLANMKGEEVAARVSQEDAGRDEWFVVKVINFDKETREFEVLDEEPGDDEEGGGQRKYKLPMSHIIPFSKRTDLSSVQDFHSENMFWRYIQKRLPCTKPQLSKLESYVLEFDDDEEDGSLPQRLVPFHRVVPLPEGYRQ